MLFFYCYKLWCIFVSFFIQLTKTFGSKRLVPSNSYHVLKAQIKTVTSTINMIKKIYDIIHCLSFNKKFYFDEKVLYKCS